MINFHIKCRWCSKVEEIKEFFNVIKREYTVVKSHSGINAGAKTIYEKVKMCYFKNLMF